MKKLTAGIFATLLTVVTVGAANANIASQGYVDEQVKTVDDKVSTNTQSINSLTTTVGQHTTSIESLQSTKANVADVYTKGETDTELAKKQDKALIQTAQYSTNKENDTSYPSVKAVSDAIAAATTGIASDSDVAALKTKVGTADLETEAKDLSGAVNELNTGLTAAEGNITSLQSGKADKATTLEGYGITDGVTKTAADAAYAVKNTETVASTASTNAQTALTNIGTLTELTTDAKTNTVVAINEVASEASAAQSAADKAQGDVDNLTTRVSQNETDISRIDGELDTMATSETIGNLQNLTTTEKSNLVGAINELDSTKQEKLSGTTGSATQPVYLNNGVITAGEQLGGLATKDSVTAAEIGANAVVTEKIMDGNVTKAKLETSVQTSLNKADAAIPAPSAEQVNEGGKYVLTWDGTTGYAWENIERGTAE